MAGKRPPIILASDRASGVPMWLKVIGVAIAALIAAHFYLTHQINKFADTIVQTVGMFANASHRGGYYTWDGNLGIKKLRIESNTSSSGGLYMSALELDTPGWWWVLQLMNPMESSGTRVSRAFDRAAGDRSGAVLPATDSLYLRLRGFELEINDLLPPGLPEIGFSTGMPFETEGCSNIRYFVPLQLQNDLRLPYKQTDLSFGFTATGSDQVTVSLQIDAAGVVSSSFEMDWKTDQPRRFLEADGEGERASAMRWIVNDQGFNAARNAWCAEDAGVDADEFQRRHITTVRRILEVYGVLMAPETEAVYSAFASNGGTLTMEAKWPSEISPELFAQYAPEQQWEVMKPEIWHDNAARTSMALSFVKARPLPNAFSGSVYDLITRNADAGADGAGSPLTQLGDRMRELTAAPTEAAAAGAPAKAEAEPPPSRPSRPQPTQIGLDTPSLTAAVGRTVAIETVEGRTSIGQLLAVDKKTVTIQQRVSGGKADLDFSRERIRTVTVNPVLR